jgi:hypothetical protein
MSFGSTFFADILDSRCSPTTGYLSHFSLYPLSQLEVEAYDRSRCKKKVGGARSSSRDRESGRRPR